MATTTTAISQEAWRFPGLLASPGRDSSALLEVPESLADRLEHDLVVDPPEGTTRQTCRQESQGCRASRRRPWGAIVSSP